MGELHQDVTEAELAVLQALWDAGPATIRQLVERVYRQTGTSVYGTVQKLLERLEAKGFVGRDRSEAVHVFRAAGRPRRADRPSAPRRGRLALRRLAHAAVDAPGRGQGPVAEGAARASRVDRPARRPAAEVKQPS